MGSYRELELLVSRIEGALAPAGAVIRSPDHIQDLFTVESREVDVSIRYRVGSVELLVTVECRDRIKTEDVTWIEQLATKRDHIGAAHTIAVSSTGFSAPSVKAAKLHGISTRIIGELSDADIIEWIEKLQIEEVDTACQLGRLHLVYEGDHPGARMVPELEQEWTQRGFEALIFTDQKTGAKLSVVDVIRRATGPKSTLPTDAIRPVTVTLPPQASMIVSDDPLTVLARNVPTDGSTVEQTHWIEAAERQLSMRTTCGVLNVLRIGLEITMSSRRRRVPVSRAVSYSDDSKGIVDVAEHHVGRYIITQHRPAVRSSDSSS